MPELSLRNVYSQGTQSQKEANVEREWVFDEKNTSSRYYESAEGEKRREVLENTACMAAMLHYILLGLSLCTAQSRTQSEKGRGDLEKKGREYVAQNCSKCASIFELSLRFAFLFPLTHSHLHKTGYISCAILLNKMRSLDFQGHFGTPNPPKTMKALTYNHFRLLNLQYC